MQWKNCWNQGPHWLRRQRNLHGPELHSKTPIPDEELEQPLIVFNVDGTLNKKGTITHSTELDITFSTCTQKTQFLISGLEKQHLIFGFPWLEKKNLIIDWKLETLEWKQTPLKFKFCGKPTSLPEIINQTLSGEIVEPPSDKNNDQSLLIYPILPYPHQNLTCISKLKQLLPCRLLNRKKKMIIPLKELVPKEYHSYIYSIRGRLNAFLNPNLRTIRLRWKRISNQRCSRSTTCHLSNSRNWTNSSITSGKVLWALLLPKIAWDHTNSPRCPWLIK